MIYTQRQLSLFGIAARTTLDAIDYAISLSTPGASTIEIFRAVTRRVLENPEHRIAFPLLINVNNVLGHFAPNEREDYILQEGDVVTYDFGVAANSELLSADYARTIQVRHANGSLNENLPDFSNELQFHREFLDAMIARVATLDLNALCSFFSTYFIMGRPQNVQMISNLGGHEISPGVLHGTREIFINPSRRIGDSFLLPEGVYTIEPILVFHNPGSIVEQPLVTFSREIHSGFSYEFLTTEIPTLPEEHEQYNQLLVRLFQEYGHVHFGTCFCEEQILLTFPEYTSNFVRETLSLAVSHGFLREMGALVMDQRVYGSHFEESFYVSHSPNGIVVTNLREL